jgi:phage FluMu protein gp41
MICCVTDRLVVGDDSELELRVAEVVAKEVLDACPKAEDLIELEEEV